MNRIMTVIVVAVAAALGAAWLMDNPGSVTWQWLGGEGSMSTTTAIGTVVGAVVVLVLLIDGARQLVRLPRRRAERRERERQEAALRAFSEGFLALAAGQRDAATRALGTANADVVPDLYALLEVQTAQFSGDKSRAEALFAKLEEVPATRLIGLRGRFIEATRRSEHTEALAAARAALADDPTLGWAAVGAFEAAARAGAFDAALAVLESNHKHGLIDARDFKRLSGVMLTELARLHAASDPETARKQAFEAYELVPDLVPAAVLAARLSRGKGKRGGQPIIEAAWRLAPHPDLMAAAIGFDGTPSATERLDRAEALAHLAPTHPESCIGVATAAMAARNLDRARAALAPLLDGRPTRRVALLMAELEATAGAEVRAREWLRRALTAAPDPTWVADGATYARWQVIAPASGAIDRMVWTMPPSDGAGEPTLTTGDGGAAEPRRKPAMVNLSPEPETPSPPEAPRPSVPIARSSNLRS